MKRLIAPAVSAILLAGCLADDKSAGRGTVVDNELRTGFIYLADGHPAIGARVRVYPVGYVPDSAALRKRAAGPSFSTRTDSRGRFQLDSLPTGEYNILAESDGLFSQQDSVYLSARIDSVPSDTLAEPGSLTGVVALQPQDNPMSVVVQALGTNSYANVDEDGRFTLADLGAGRYTLRVSTTLDEYTPLIVHARIRAGKADTLADSLRLPFTGIPIVQGLRAAYDTLSGTVTLSWRPAHYRSFSEYQIFRDRSPALLLSQTAIASTLDTVYRDKWDAESPYLGAAFGKWEYRVRIKSLSDLPGPTYGKVVVDVVEPARIATLVDLVVVRAQWDPDTRKDDYLVLARLTNRGRGIKEIEWSVDDPGEKRAVRALGGTYEESDSLAFRWERQGPFTVYTRITDDGGDIVQGQLRIQGNQAPSLTGSPAMTAYTSVPYLYAPQASDPDGDALRFTITGKPAWAAFDSLTGSLRGTPSAGQEGVYPGITLSVSDGRRSTSLPPFEIRIERNPHTLMKPYPSPLLPKYNPFIISLGGTILAVGAWPEIDYRMGVREYDPATESWKGPYRLDSQLDVESVKDAFAADGLVYIQDRTTLWYYDPIKKESGILDRGMTGYYYLGTVGGYAYFAVRMQAYPYAMRVLQYDFKTRAVAVKSVLPEYLADRVLANDFQGIPVDGKIFLTCSYHNKWFVPSTAYYLYDPELDSWSLPAANPRFRAYTIQCAVDGKVYSAGGERGGDGKLGYMDEYDPDQDRWRPVSGLISFKKASIRCAEADGRGYFMFGEVDGSDASGSYEIESYDPSAEK